MFRTIKLLQMSASKGLSVRHNYSWLAALALLGASPAAFSSNAPVLAPGHPDRYEVVKGDNLWDIAGRFLEKPWRWPDIWENNPEIQNPDLIYPGDVLVLDYSGAQPLLRHLRSQKLSSSGLPVVKLSPKIRASDIHDAIPTIPPSQILPFLRDTLILENATLNDAGYVTVGVDDKFILGKHAEFYARGVEGDEGQTFKIFKEGNVLKHPDTGEILGYETVFLGDAIMLREGETSKFLVTRSVEEIVPGNRMLLADDEMRFPSYHPHAPGRIVKGRILDSVDSVADMGDKSIVIISLGAREGMEEGHVLRVLYEGGERIDPVTKKVYKLPEENSGLIMVFRVYDKVSYGLLLNSVRSVKVNDIVTTP